MHPVRALWEWYNVVHWTSLIKIQDVNTRYLVSHLSCVPPTILDSFKMAAMKKRQNAVYSVISASYHLVCLLFEQTSYI